MKRFLETVLIALIVAMAVAVLGFALVGTDASRSKIWAIGAEHHVELWSGGRKVQEWTSTGKVLCESGSDGYFFRDKESGKLVRVSGDLVITPIE